MKITVNQYAKSLYEATEGKSQKEIDKAVFNLAKILQKNGQIKIASKIFNKFTEIWNQEKGIVEAEVTTRSKMGDRELGKVESYIKEKYQAKEVVLRNIIDENIQGGIIIRVGDEILDGSIARQLQELKNNLSI